jgi:hypothetical protein
MFRLKKGWRLALAMIAICGLATMPGTAKAHDDEKGHRPGECGADARDSFTIAVIPDTQNCVDNNKPQPDSLKTFKGETQYLADHKHPMNLTFHPAHAGSGAPVPSRQAVTLSSVGHPAVCSSSA